MNKLLISSASILCLFIGFVPVAKAEIGASEKPTNTRVEEYNQETKTTPNGQMNSDHEMNSGEMNSGEMNSDHEMNSDEMNSDEMNSDEMNSDEMNSDEMNSDEMNSGEMNSDEMNSDEMNSDEMNSSSKMPRTKAFNLVNSAYRGKFKEQGIPSYNAFMTKYGTGQVTAKKLVQAAIDAGQLSSDTINDKSYINAVSFQLRNLQHNS